MNTEILNTQSVPLSNGQRVSLDELTGHVISVISAPVPKFRPYYSYYIQWDNGNQGIVDENKLKLLQSCVITK